jgi:predicted site-specific integrase-resolvase
MGESIGTAIMRATLHTWFHAGEINAVRQMLGHAEMPFVGAMLGRLEWQEE